MALASVKEIKPLKEWREQRKLTQKQVAERTKGPDGSAYSFQHYSAVERGDAKATDDFLKSVAHVLEISSDQVDMNEASQNAPLHDRTAPYNVSEAMIAIEGHLITANTIARKVKFFEITEDVESALKKLPPVSGGGISEARKTETDQQNQGFVTVAKPIRDPLRKTDKAAAEAGKKAAEDAKKGTP